MDMLIGGKYISSDDVIEVKNPYNGEVIDAVPIAAEVAKAAKILLKYLTRKLKSALNIKVVPYFINPNKSGEIENNKMNTQQNNKIYLNSPFFASTTSSDTTITRAIGP